MMRVHDDDFWDPKRDQAHPMLRDSEDPEEFYDWLTEWRDAERARRIALIIVSGALCGLLVGLFIWIFAVVR